MNHADNLLLKVEISKGNYASGSWPSNQSSQLVISSCLTISYPMNWMILMSHYLQQMINCGRQRCCSLIYFSYLLSIQLTHSVTGCHLITILHHFVVLVPCMLCTYLCKSDIILVSPSIHPLTNYYSLTKSFIPLCNTDSLSPLFTHLVL